MNFKKIVATGIAAAAILTSAIPAFAAGGPTTGPVAGPGCFGNWRAGSVQALNEAGYGPVGKNFFAVRAGDNSTINAANRDTCASL